MRLYLMQHGEALSKETDPQRPLSERGEREVMRMAHWFARQSPSVVRIVHSGKRRAEQTAQLMAGVIAPEAALGIDAGVSPKADVQGFAEQLGHWQGETLLVSHMPFVSRLGGYLLSGDPQGEWIGFTPGALLSVERTGETHWQMHWMVSPGLIGRD